MTDKEKYQKLCSSELSIPVFSRDWWLDCICGVNNWGIIIIEEDDVIVASMPLYEYYPGVISMPPYTQTMGIWFNPQFCLFDYGKELVRKQELCNEIIQKIPANKSFHQNFNFTFTDWLPFYWNNYKQTTRYTYVLPDISDEQILWNNLSNDIKRNINKGQNKYNLQIKKGISTEIFLEIRKKTFAKRGIKPIDSTILEHLIYTCRLRNQGDIWGAFDDNGEVHAAVFIVMQESCAYCIAAGGDPKLRKSGAHALVLWNAIKEVSSFSSSFDFEGSMIKGVENFFRGFGAIQTPYFSITKGKLSFIEKVFHYSMKKIKKRIKKDS